MNLTKSFLLINHVLYLTFFISLIFSFRAISSISIGLILATGIIKNKIETKTFFHKNLKNFSLAGCLLLYLLYIISLLYTHNIHEGWNNIRIKSGLLFTPLAICFTNYVNTDTRTKLFRGYCLALGVASLNCLGGAFFHYLKTGETLKFFYHALVSPLHHHAVYFSIFVFIALVFLFEDMRKNTFMFNKPFHIFLLLYFSVFLFLLSSKLVIVFFLLYLLYYCISLIKKKKTGRMLAIGSLILFITIGSLVLTIRNPISERFYELLHGDIKILNQDRFDPGKYFNGLEFRMLQWKFVAEILTENHRWWIGVGPGDAQLYLDQKYILANMYTGDPARSDRGLLGYNTHNQFLETLLQTGIIGLIILLALCISLVRMAMQKKSRCVSFIIILLLSWMFSESVFETQYGIMIFTFFPLFIYRGENG
jgi:O-antigen ligase